MSCYLTTVFNFKIGKINETFIARLFVRLNYALYNVHIVAPRLHTQITTALYSVIVRCIAHWL